MKTNYYIIILFLTFNFCKAQSNKIIFNTENFETDFLNYKPVQKNDVSEKDFEWAKFVISETKKDIKDKSENYNVAHYWNILSAFDKLQENKATLKLVFTKMANSKGSCGYITSFKDEFKFVDKIPKLYNQYYKECKNKEKYQTEFNIDEYISDNKLNSSLVKLINTISLNDQKFRGSDEQTFKTKQPKLDEQNEKLIDSLLTEHKQYIGRSLVGKKFETVMWSVIQHSNPEMMEKYLPIIHKAVENKELDKTPLKMLVDRFYGLKYGYQIFGSQSGFGFKMADDETRNKIIKQYGIE